VFRSGVLDSVEKEYTNKQIPWPLVCKKTIPTER
jgi:hypothetical protein